MAMDRLRVTRDDSRSESRSTSVSSNASAASATAAAPANPQLSERTRTLQHHPPQQPPNPNNQSNQTSHGATERLMRANAFTNDASISAVVPRSALSLLFSSPPNQPTSTRRPSPLENSNEYTSRRSEPSLSTAELALVESRGTCSGAELDGPLVTRRSLPSANRANGAAQDLDWALQSIQENAQARQGSSTSGGFVPRTNQRPLLGSYSAGPRPASRSAYQLQRAHSADVVPLTEPIDMVAQLRRTIVDLQRSLEEEKKRRANDEKLFQHRILELQGVIRHNMPEQRRELERNVQTTRASQSSQTSPTSATTTALVCPTRTPQQQSVPAATARARALRSNSHLHQLQTAQAQSPYVTMRLLSELGTEELDGNTDDDGAVDDEDEDDHDHEDEDDEEEEAAADQSQNKDANQGQDGNGQEVRDATTRGKGAKDTSAVAEPQTIRAVEERLALQLTRLRARMRSAVAAAQREAALLQQRLEEEKKLCARRDHQLRLETSVRVASLEDRHRYAKQRLQAKISMLTAQIAALKDENESLHDHVLHKDQRIQQLELALGGRRIVSAYSSSPSTTQQQQQQQQQLQQQLPKQQQQQQLLPQYDLQPQQQLHHLHPHQC